MPFSDDDALLSRFLGPSLLAAGQRLVLVVLAISAAAALVIKLI